APIAGQIRKGFFGCLTDRGDPHRRSGAQQHFDGAPQLSSGYLASSLYQAFYFCFAWRLPLPPAPSECRQLDRLFTVRSYDERRTRVEHPGVRQPLLLILWHERSAFAFQFQNGKRRVVEEDKDV